MRRVLLLSACAALAVTGVATASPPSLLHPATLTAKAPAVAAAWQGAAIPDDPVKRSNTKGTITFADAGPNTRTTQVFINLANNTSLDSQGFAPFGKVSSGMSVVERLYAGYGDRPSADQQQIMQQGDSFLRKHFPRLDRIETARLAAG